jgi:hypothetical protein
MTRPSLPEFAGIAMLALVTTVLATSTSVGRSHTAAAPTQTASQIPVSIDGIDASQLPAR